MADAKKNDKKSDKGGGKKDSKKKGNTWEDVVLLILGLITIFFVVIPQLSPTSDTDEVVPGTVVNSDSNGGIFGAYNKLFGQQTEQVMSENGQLKEVVTGPSLVEEAKFRLSDLFSSILIFVAILSIFLSCLFAILWQYNKFRIKLITDAYNKKIGWNVEKESDVPKVVPAGYVPDTNGIRNPKWELVEKYYNSGNQSDWRIAIIEADILLFEVLQTSGFKGNTVGEMLKNANVAQLQTLQIAWKSHLIRNRLAHEGASLQLTRHMVEEAIEGFRAVFNELNFI